MAKRFKDGDLIGLTPEQALFVIEFCKDCNARRAAVASGHHPDSGYKLRDLPVIAAAIQVVLMQRLESSHIDAEWVLMEAVDNHVIARQAGNITASNTALTLIAKHTLVDAMATDKLNLNLNGDKEVVERLQRARQRLNQVEDDEEVNFF